MKTFEIENISHVLSTHKHWDHSGGNQALKEKFSNLEVVGGAKDEIPACTLPVND
jgi:glyoxylase-like metal-dependent hydrolase (beta-lactamase superfamily II)